MNPVNVGKFTNKKTIIHHLDPRLKLISFMLLMTVVLLPIGFFGYIGLTFFFIFLMMVSKIRLKIIGKILFNVFLIFLFIVILQILFNLKDITEVVEGLFKGDHAGAALDKFKVFLKSNEKVYEISGKTPAYVYQVNKNTHFLFQAGKGGWASKNIKELLESQNWKAFSNNGFRDIVIIWKKVKFSFKDLVSNVFIVYKIFLMIALTSILTRVISTVDLTYALEWLLSPLKLIKFPVTIVAMIISIALRFIPTIFNELQNIMKAQASRGVDFKNKGFFGKMKSLISLIIPIITISILRAQDLSHAMIARQYSIKNKRSRYHSYTLRAEDWIVWFYILAIIAFFIISYLDITSFPLLKKHVFKNGKFVDKSIWRQFGKAIFKDNYNYISVVNSFAR